ncbi:MAG: hypothetical protein R3C59_27565 [Planctomycetaceae bacterium]
MMRTILMATITLTCVSATSYGQSDLQKIGRFLQDVQRIQNQNQGQQQYNNGNGVRRAPSYSNPNTSGNMNAGGFQNNNNLFGPQGGFQNNNNYSNPNTSGNMNAGRFQNNNNLFGPQGGYNNGGYNPNYNNYPSYNQYPQSHNHRIVTPGYNQYPNTVHSTVPSYPGTSLSTSRPVYSDPPIAPKVYSNLPIVIRCAPDCTGTCSYSLLSGSGKSYPYTIRAGQIQNLKESTDWKFSYQPDGGASQTYALRGGRTYELRQNGGQWQFYLVP